MVTNKKRVKKIILWLISILLFNFLYTATEEITFYTTIQTIINAEKVLELPVYYIKNQQEKYVLIKDLSKIFYATSVYYPVGKYVGFNCRGEKIYFFFDKNYFIWSNKRIFLNSNVLNIKNRTFIPISILNNPDFVNIVNADVEYRQKEGVLLINWKDTVEINYYVTKNEAKIEFKYPYGTQYNYDIDNQKIILTFFSGKVQPKEFKVEGGIISKITLCRQNGNVVSEIFLSEELQKVNIRKEENKNKVLLYFEKISQYPEQKIVVSKQQNSVLTQIRNDLKSENIKNDKETEDKNLAKKMNRLIVIDPGHGGEDPGAIGKYKTEEKNVNLKISLLVKQKLLEEGFNVLLTREEDIFVPLVKRTEFANKNNADLFISIHCNAAEKPTGTDHGFEIYFLSEKATDSDAVSTEKLENEVVRFEKQTEELTKLQKLLWSMIVNEFINESSKLCSLIGKEVTDRTQQVYRGVKQAGFYVLRGAQMPAILVECGFISNPNEELKLNRYEFQNMIANGIVAGIKKYYENNE